MMWHIITFFHIERFIPFGIVTYGNKSPRVASRIGDHAIDLLELFNAGLLQPLDFEQKDFEYIPFSLNEAR